MLQDEYAPLHAWRIRLSRALSQREPPVLPGWDAHDERWELVLRIASSRFSKAPQLREIFFYICQRALADPGITIKEYEIGCTVLGRKPDFNPNDDNIVRVQVSHLRKKLEEYFSSDGKDEPIQITVPKGSYVPRFEPKAPMAHSAPILLDAPKLDASRTETPQLERAQPVTPRSSRPLSRILIASMIVFCAVGCIVMIAWRYGAPSRAVNRVAAAALESPAQDPLWARVFGGGQTTGIVVSDTCLVMLQDILHTDISVGEYSASPKYPEQLLGKEPDLKLRSALELVAGRQYTSLADTNIASRLRAVSQQFGNSRASIRYARHLNIRDFKTQSFVLIGSRRGIPWVQLFEPQLNFSLEEQKPNHQFYFRNRKPKAGEPSAYVPAESGGTLESYADIALLPNLGNTGSVLLLSGITMEASEAAGELVVGGNFTKEVTRMLGQQAVQERYFEVLIKTSSTAGATRNSQVVAQRVIQPGESAND